MTRSRIIGSAVALSALASFLPGGAFADADQAVATAAQHSALAANASEIAMVHRHLHHALNCLVGPDGEGFDAAAGNPCAAAGGAIPQTSDSDMKMKLEMAAKEIRDGIANESADGAKEKATAVQAMLK